MSWLSWIVQQWAWKCQYLFEILISFLLDKYPEVEMLDHSAISVLIFWGAPILVSIKAALFCIPTSGQGFHFLRHCYFLASIIPFEKFKVMVSHPFVHCFFSLWWPKEASFHLLRHEISVWKLTPWSCRNLGKLIDRRLLSSNQFYFCPFSLFFDTLFIPVA